MSSPDLQIFEKKIPFLSSTSSSSSSSTSQKSVQIRLGVTRISKFFVDWRQDYHGTITECSSSKTKIVKSCSADGKDNGNGNGNHSDLINVDDYDSYLVKYDEDDGDEWMSQQDVKCYLAYHEAILPLLKSSSCKTKAKASSTGKGKDTDTGKGTNTGTKTDSDDNAKDNGDTSTATSTGTGMRMDKFGCYGYICPKNNETPKLIAQKYHCDVSVILQDEMNRIRYGGGGSKRRSIQLKSNSRFKAGSLIRLDPSLCHHSDRDKAHQERNCENEVGDGSGTRTGTGASAAAAADTTGTDNTDGANEKEIPLSVLLSINGGGGNKLESKSKQSPKSKTSSALTMSSSLATGDSRTNDNGNGNDYEDGDGDGFGSDNNKASHSPGKRSGAITVHFPRTKCNPECTRMMDYSPRPGFQVKSSDSLYHAVSLIQGPWALVPSCNADNDDADDNGKDNGNDRGQHDYERIFMIEETTTHAPQDTHVPLKKRKNCDEIVHHHNIPPAKRRTLSIEKAKAITIDEIISGRGEAQKNLHVWTDVRRKV